MKTSRSVWLRMAQRRRRKSNQDLTELFAKLALGSLLLISLALGGLRGFAKVFSSLTSLLLILGVAAIVVFIAIIVVKRFSTKPPANTPTSRDAIETIASLSWSEESIVEKLHAIDWFQFEKFNAAILRKEGWLVERKGGASPDGGVDLIASRGESRMLVQCKHWKTWRVQEKVIRELLGSMTHFGAKLGALHTLAGWTPPAEAFAGTHGIRLSDARALAKRARATLTDMELVEWLLSDKHHCPKCEALMVLRTGDFPSFWGCSTFPKCRGILREA